MESGGDVEFFRLSFVQTTGFGVRSAARVCARRGMAEIPVHGDWRVKSQIAIHLALLVLRDGRGKCWNILSRLCRFLRVLVRLSESIAR